MPWWVLAVFVWCLWTGWRKSKEGTTHVSMFFLFPIIFIGIAIKSLAVLSMGCVTGYFAGLSFGSLLGWSVASATHIKINKFRNMITVPGSWQLMILLMTVFITKFTFGFLRIAEPATVQTFQVIEWSVLGFVTGVLLGKALNFARRFMLVK